LAIGDFDNDVPPSYSAYLLAERTS